MNLQTTESITAESTRAMTESLGADGELEGTESIAADRKGVRYTLHLTEALENGELSPEEYARQRADVVGRANIIQSLILPILASLFSSVSHLFRLNGTKQPRIVD